MKKVKIIVIVILGLFISAVLISYIIWLGYPKKSINMYILDKTVHDFSYSKHRSLFWLLNNTRIMKPDGSNYNVSRDYFGFHPLKPLSDCQYEIKHISLEQIDSLTNAYDAAYYVDTRGVYFNEWFRGFRQRGENSVIEGGLNQNDYIFLKAMKEKGKLIIGEYSLLEPPTSDLIGFKTEELFGIHSTGWAGKYFNSLDSSNLEIPANIISLYKYANNGQWPFSGEGIILRNAYLVIVLQARLQLNYNIPIITSSGETAEQMKLPAKIDYYNWFELIAANDTTNIIANYQLNLTASGDSMLKAHGLSAIFPAVVGFNNNKYHTYYFAGDYATNPVRTIFARLANSRKALQYLTFDKEKKFFQQFYFPMVENILENYSKELAPQKDNPDASK